MASEQTPARAPRRTIFLGVGLAVLLVAGAIALLLQRDGADDEAIEAGGRPTAGDGNVAPPVATTFRFSAKRRLVPTAAVKLGRRDRRAITRAWTSAETVLRDLYVEGFLDPANRMEGAYADAFRGFAGDAKREATRRAGLLTAGANAGTRYERIEPRSARIVTRVLLDRAGRPALLMSIVRFSATATGDRPATLRSFGRFFLERRGGSWKIVSFHVARRDTAGDST